MPDYLLDACALLALYNMEQGWDVVRDLLAKAGRGEITVSMNAVNLMEVYYDRIRKVGKTMADDIIQKIYSYPLAIIEKNDRDIVREASYIKASGKLSLADAFLVATAKCTGAAVVTADWGELEKIEMEGYIPFYWIRPKQEKE